MAKQVRSDHISLPGSSGTAHAFDVSRWTATHADSPAVYTLLSYHGGDASQGPTVLYVGETENLAAELSLHRSYPCMETFVDAVGSLPAVAALERAGIRQDLISAHKPPCETCWPPMPVEAGGPAPYPDRVVGGCLAQLALLDLRLEHAVRQRRVIRFVHERRHCEVEPHVYGIQADGHTALFAYQTSFGAGGGSMDPWKTFRLSEIHGLVITDRPCGGARPYAESPIAVTFIQSEAVALRAAGERVPDDTTPEALGELRRKVAGAVRQLRAQAFELRRIEADCARLAVRLARSDAPPELASTLAAIQSARPRVEQGLIDLIPEVAELQRRLPSIAG